MKSLSTSEAILRYWFGQEADDSTVAKRQAALWWSKNPELDRDIRERFEAMLPSSATASLADRQPSARERLATIILLDQFPRNIYRGSAVAFAWDGQAQRQASAALALGDEALLRPIQRVFLYMPFEHAENMELQELAVERFAFLARSAQASEREALEGFLDFAVRHRDVISRFGRFPHRNAILGRPSTAEETEFLQKPGSSF